MNKGLYLITGLGGDRERWGSTTPAVVENLLRDPWQVALEFWEDLEAAEHAVYTYERFLARPGNGAYTAKANIAFARY